MIRMNLWLFGGGGSGSGGSKAGGSGKTSTKLGNEIYTSRGIKKGQEYAVINTSKGETMVRNGSHLLEQIAKGTLKYNDDLYHWVTAKGSYIIRHIVRKGKR